MILSICKEQKTQEFFIMLETYFVVKEKKYIYQVTTPIGESKNIVLNRSTISIHDLNERFLSVTYKASPFTTWFWWLQLLSLAIGVILEKILSLTFESYQAFNNVAFLCTWEMSQLHVPKISKPKMLFAKKISLTTSNQSDKYNVKFFIQPGILKLYLTFSHNLICKTAKILLWRAHKHKQVIFHSMTKEELHMIGFVLVSLVKCNYFQLDGTRMTQIMSELHQHHLTSFSTFQFNCKWNAHFLKFEKITFGIGI